MPLSWRRWRNRMHPAILLRSRWREMLRSPARHWHRGLGGNLAVESDQRRRSAAVEILVYRVSPHDVGLALEANRDAQEIKQATVPTGRAADSHGADCAKMVRDLRDLSS